ncbi:alpha/beta hydrolase [Streptomyces sp. NPDC008313]|uniref:alpha/beta hydrolase n=1 Tax=Streptomyces sp. NPDC008313 TaxID=3364826 RepID=UPI0036F0394F
MLTVHQRCACASVAALTLFGAGLPPAAAAGGDPDLSRFYHQRITWSACEGEGMPEDMRCGKVTVPLDYERPADGTMDVALARFRATGGSRGSVFLNFGGPGGSGIDQLALGGKDFMGLTDGYDVVTFDPRGVGRSSPVSCGETPGQAPDTSATGPGDDDPRAVLGALKKTAADCAKHSGPVLEHIGTVNAARDMDVMRQALGDKKLNYLGFSYGTRLGAVYAAQFPRKVGRMALDGVDTLTEPLSEQGLVAAEGQQTALESFLGWCTENIACPFGQDARTARARVVQLADSLERDPVPTDFGGQFTDQDLAGAIGQALYSRQMWPVLEQALGSLIQDGDTRGLEQLSYGTAFPATRRPLGPGTGGTGGTDGGLVDAEDVPMDNLPAALMAINCADDPDRLTETGATDEIGRLRAAYEEASPVFGEYRLTQVLMCYGRPAGTDYIREKVHDVDTAKMLLVGTRGDPATPYRWTLETADRLGPSAVVLDNRSEGHTGYASSACVHKKVDDFLLYGSLPHDGSSCGPEDGDH